MQISTRALMAVFLFCAMPWVAHAAPLDALYVAETRVADEASETRNNALGQLLAEVLARVSGNPAIAAQPAAAELLAAAPSLVQQYRYRAVDGDGPPGRVLWARFDRGGVERMMRERGLPVWQQRPSVLLWTAIERQGRRSLLNLDTVPAVRDAVSAHAAGLGMPLQLPLVDLEDQSSLAPADLWSDLHSGIRAASQRYPHQVVLTARLGAQGKDRWRGSWTLIGGDGRASAFQTPALDMAASLAAGLDQAQAMLAARYAPAPAVAGNTGVLVRFGDVGDLSAYGRLTALLAGLQSVDQVALRAVDGDALVFEFGLRGDRRDLQQALDATGRVVADAVPVSRLAPAVANTSAAGAQSPVAAEPPAHYQADLHYRLLH